MPRTTKNNQKAWKTQWKKMTKILPKASPRDPHLLYMGGRWLRLCRLNSHPEPILFHDGCSWGWVVTTLFPSQTPAHATELPPNSPEVSLFFQKTLQNQNRKKTKKPSLPKTAFFTQFLNFLIFARVFFLVFRGLGPPPGLIFGLFLRHACLAHFLRLFLQKKKHIS